MPCRARRTASSSGTCCRISRATGYPAALTSWEGDRPIASFGSAPFNVAWDTVRLAALEAERGTPVEGAFRVGAYGVRVVAVPMRGGALTILLAPRTRLIGSDAYARWYGLNPGEAIEPPYTVQVVGDPLAPRETINWRATRHRAARRLAGRGPRRARRARTSRWTCARSTR